MAMHLVQLGSASARRVALVEEPHLRCLVGAASIYELALYCLEHALSLGEYARSLATGEVLTYDEVYGGNSEWKLLTPVDVPEEPSRLLVAGTGLTHLGSARQRQAMHLADAPKADVPMTDSMRMFEWGVERGRPAEGEIGVAPEWFYKGDGSVLRAPFAALEIPDHAEDGGEEAELAGVYVIAQDGTPWLVGMAQGNEFSDHKFEKRNYLNLAGSKLRECSLGPELVVGAGFGDVRGEVRIERDGSVIWQKSIASGEENMCHSLANLEHHHFKFAGHRQPGGVHVHFFGADALSFGDGVVLRDGDVMVVAFEGFGRALRNVVREVAKTAQPVRVRSLA
ncbi:AraD1 family protein [Granulicella sp. WH15]|uniref:AraD1 family protein n=1 Tax=Granulicella sp. WH15 TaxID=2602070 RepID=UPI002102A10E|nr:AraD1 family protein [Granulicella sp. WH15]